MKSLLVLLVVSTCSSVTAAQPADFKYVDCCEYPDPSMYDDHVERTCSPNVGQNDTQSIEVLSCQMACILKEMDLLVDDAINMEKYHQIIENTTAGDGEAKQFYYAKLDLCRKTVDEYEKHHSFENFPFNKKCSMKNFVIMLCLTSAVAIECPEGKQVKSAECDAQRKSLQRLMDELGKE